MSTNCPKQECFRGDVAGEIAWEMENGYDSFIIFEMRYWILNQSSHWKRWPSLYICASLQSVLGHVHRSSVLQREVLSNLTQSTKKVARISEAGNTPELAFPRCIEATWLSCDITNSGSNSAWESGSTADVMYRYFTKISECVAKWGLSSRYPPPEANYAMPRHAMPGRTVKIHNHRHCGEFKWVIDDVGSFSSSPTDVHTNTTIKYRADLWSVSSSQTAVSGAVRYFFELFWLSFGINTHTVLWIRRTVMLEFFTEMSFWFPN